MKPQKAVIDETIHIAIGSIIMAIIMLIVFAIVGRFDLSVLLGALAGTLFAIGNFFALGLTVQKAVVREDRKKSIMQLSYSVRMLLMVALIIIASRVSFLNWIALAIALLFPRITIFIMNIYMQINGKKAEKKAD